MADHDRENPESATGEENRSGEGEANRPKRKRLERSGQMSEEALRPFAEARQEAEEKSGSENKGLVDQMLEQSTEGRKPVPTGWFYLLGLALAVVVIWMAVQIFSADRKEDLDSAGAAVDEGNSGALARAGQWEAAREDFDRMQEKLIAFLEAETLEERAKSVRHPERVIPLMEDYYQRNDFQTFSYKQIDDFRPFALDHRSFRVLAVETGEEAQVPVLMADSPESLSVDWESFVCYQPIDPEVYLKTRPSEPVSMRVYGTLDDFYVYEFADETKYRCLRLNFRGSEAELFGYLERKSESAQKLKQFLARGDGFDGQPIIARLRFSRDSREKRCVLIEDIESFLWAYPENPDEKEPGP